MIEAKGVTKTYGDFVALDDVSFQIGKGEVVGLLGPNGAGKTTLIRALTGYFEANHGTIHIAGLDIQSDPIGAQKHIGYLPENTPLYPEMLVQEYLAMVANFRDLDEGKRESMLAEAIYATGIEDRLTTPIADLSKGFRQRVGLAQAIVHQPKVLILDEPTSGLDPNQVALVRELIKRLSKHSTVIFSTHILSEVELICERAIILIDGKIQKDANLKELASGSGALVAVVADSDEPQRPLTSPGKAGVKTAEGVAQKLGTLPGVTGVVQRSGHRDHLTYELQGALDASICRDIYRLAREETWELGELRPLTHNLETTFRDVVQSAQVTPKRQPQSGEVSA
jgi:ABC-2 type transport system ATP-binding protein